MYSVFKLYKSDAKKSQEADFLGIILSQLSLIQNPSSFPPHLNLSLTECSLLVIQERPNSSLGVSNIINHQEKLRKYTAAVRLPHKSTTTTDTLNSFLKEKEKKKPVTQPFIWTQYICKHQHKTMWRLTLCSVLGYTSSQEQKTPKHTMIQHGPPHLTNETDLLYTDPYNFLSFI